MLVTTHHTHTHPLEGLWVSEGVHIRLVFGRILHAADRESRRSLVALGATMQAIFCHVDGKCVCQEHGPQRVPPARCAPCVRVHAAVCGCAPCCTWALEATVSLRFKSWGHVLQHVAEPGMPDFCWTHGARYPCRTVVQRGHRQGCHWNPRLSCEHRRGFSSPRVPRFVTVILPSYKCHPRMYLPLASLGHLRAPQGQDVVQATAAVKTRRRDVLMRSGSGESVCEYACQQVRTNVSRCS